MKVAGLDSDNDWTFGRGLATYKTNKAAVVQSVTTRLKSFANDWFLDMSANIDWIGLTGQLGAQSRIIAEVERVVLSTNGVAKLDSIDVTDNRASRRATITIRYSTIFDDLPGQVTEIIEV